MTNKHKFFKAFGDAFEASATKHGVITPNGDGTSTFGAGWQGMPNEFAAALEAVEADMSAISPMLGRLTEKFFMAALKGEFVGTPSTRLQ